MSESRQTVRWLKLQRLVISNTRLPATATVLRGDDVDCSVCSPILNSIIICICATYLRHLRTAVRIFVHVHNMNTRQEWTRSGMSTSEGQHRWDGLERKHERQD